MFGEDQFGFRRGKETRGATGMLRVSECTLDIDEEVCAHFTDWQNCLNWAKLMQILKNTGSDWCERYQQTVCGFECY